MLDLGFCYLSGIKYAAKKPKDCVGITFETELHQQEVMRSKQDARYYLYSDLSRNRLRPRLSGHLAPH